MQIPLSSHAKEYIAFLEKKLKQLENISKNTTFNSVDFRTALDNIKFNDVGNKNFLYMIEIKEGNPKKRKVIQDGYLSAKKDSTIKFPKVNVDSKSDILYLGKSSTNFKGRLKTHLKTSSPTMYALHLEYFEKHPKMKEIEFVLHYAFIDFGKEIDEKIHDELLELLESSLHHHYKPLLGRIGH